MEKAIEKSHKNTGQQERKNKCDLVLEQTFYSLLDDDMKLAYDRINEQKSEVQFAKSATAYTQGFRMGTQVAKDTSKADEDDLPF
ncbi:hypothetical protein HCA78_01830 [Listeria booriae]|uniref:Uncharacterized protein n=1 Tax=Listeria booriae TaxID=1552123 RepID=A0A842AGB5_9LIST|nr:hypothetical protein [Listeria booriae]MBC1401798.1 hypothetical protein [Listeria booriae]MBC1565868.1 hypothetical protein [Listeria booriae]MBC1616949.1 hypothetical protein [Listeria booriae]MBC2002489.1 hypothetical protein [Listeria booriae]